LAASDLKEIVETSGNNKHGIARARDSCAHVRLRSGSRGIGNYSCKSGSSSDDGGGSRDVKGVAPIRDCTN
jgi:hypothetical protein